MHLTAPPATPEPRNTDVGRSTTERQRAFIGSLLDSTYPPATDAERSTTGRHQAALLRLLNPPPAANSPTTDARGSFAERQETVPRSRYEDYTPRRVRNLQAELEHIWADYTPCTGDTSGLATSDGPAASGAVQPECALPGDEMNGTQCAGAWLYPDRAHIDEQIVIPAEFVAPEGVAELRDEARSQAHASDDNGSEDEDLEADGSEDDGSKDAEPEDNDSYAGDSGNGESDNGDSDRDHSDHSESEDGDSEHEESKAGKSSQSGSHSHESRDLAPDHSGSTEDSIPEADTDLPIVVGTVLSDRYRNATSCDNGAVYDERKFSSRQSVVFERLADLK